MSGKKFLTFSIFLLGLLLLGDAHSVQAQLSSVSTSPTPFSNAISPDGNTAYTIGFDCLDFEESCAYINVFDVTDKLHPSLIYSTTTDASMSSIVSYQNFVYASTLGKKLQVWNMIDPHNPVYISTMIIPGPVQLGGKMRVYGDNLFVPFAQDSFSGPGGVLIFSLADPEIPSLIGEIDYSQNRSGGGDAIQIGDKLYVADYFGFALRTYDLTDPSNPILIDTISNITDSLDYKSINGTNAFEPWGLASKDNALYLMDDNIIQVYDISSTTHPVYNKSIVAQKDVEGFVLKDNVLYYSSSFDDKLAYYDVTDALNPTLISETKTIESNNNYWISMDYATGYYFISSTINNKLYIYEPLKIVKSKLFVDVIKDSQSTFQLRLISQPTSTVTLTLSTTTTATEPCVTISPATLNFTTANWNTPQTVTVNSISGATGCIIGNTATTTITSSSTDLYYHNALVSDMLITVVSGFVSVSDGHWADGTTWGKSEDNTPGVDYPDSTSSANIYTRVTLFENAAVNYLVVSAGGLLNFNSKTLSIGSQSINSGTVIGDASFDGAHSYNAGAANGSITFNNEAYNAFSGIVNGDAIFNSSGFNLGRVNGTSTFNGDQVTGSGTTTGYIVRRYASNTTTSRNFLTENNRNDWVVIADGAVVNIASSTYSTTTNIFKAINGGSFVFGANSGGAVVPDVTIITPTSTSNVIKWNPSVTWGNSTGCYYSYDNFATVNTVACANNGSDIAKPSSSGSKTLYVRGVNSNGSLNEKSVLFTYDNTIAIPTSCGTDLLDESSRPYYYLTGDVTGNCVFVANAELRGASTTNVTGFTVNGSIIATSSGNGYNITLKNITITGIITASGAQNTSGAGFNGGSITIATTTTGAITSDGGNGTTQGGNGGTISITNSIGVASSTPISANGGNATVCGRGGNGGTVQLVNSSYGNISINSGSDQTVISAGLCQASPSGSSGSSGSQSVIGLYTPPPSNNNSQPPVQNQINTNDDTTPSGAGPGGNSSTKTTIVVATSTALISDKRPESTPTASVVETVKQIVKDTTEAVASSPTSKTVQTVGFFAGLLSAISLYTNALFATPLLASEVALIPLRLWGLMMVGLGIRRRTPPWGTVYDSVTKRPIDPAFVTARDAQGNVVAEATTDIDGRYGFLLPNGTYYISVAKTNYAFPSQKMTGQASDEVYKDLYFGEEVTITGGQVIDKNIPMDRMNFDWNEEAKTVEDLNVFHKKNEKLIRRIGKYIFRAGSVISVIATIVHPTTYNFILLAFYALLAVVSYYGIRGKKLGFVRDRITGKPFAYAIFRVTAPDHQTVLRSGVCDAQGRYYCIVPKGDYYVDIEKKNRDGTYTKIYQSELISNTTGIINRNFAI